MSEKRFKLCDGVKLGTHSGIWDNHKQNHQRTGDELWIGEVIGMLNEGVMIVEQNKELRKENEQLKAKVKRLQDIATRTEAEKEYYADLYNNLGKNLKLNERRKEYL